MNFSHSLSLSIVASIVTSAHAQDFYWSGDAGTQTGSDPQDITAYQWNNDGNWAGNAAGTTAGDTPLSSESVEFTTTDELAESFIVHLNGNTSRQVGIVTVNSTGSLQFVRDNNPSNTGGASLEVNERFTVGAGSGAVTFGSADNTVIGGNTFADYQRVNVEALSTALEIENNSSNVFTLTEKSILRADSAVTAATTITLSGTGSGGFVFDGAIDDTTGGGSAIVNLVINTAANTVTTLTSADSGYSGGTTLTEGTLVMRDSSNALGTGTLTLNGGRYATDASKTTVDVVIGGNVLLGGESGDIGVGSGIDFTGTVDLNGGTRTLTNRRSVDFENVVSNGGINITGTTSGHTTRFFEDNTYEGETTVSLGTLALSGSGAIDDVSAVNVVGSGATLDISGKSASSETIGSLAGGSGSSVVLGDKNLTTGDSSNTTFGGDISGSGGSLTKQGSGTMTLSSDSSYTGPTIVAEGTLVVDGDLSSSSSITVSSGATLGGSGTVGNLTISSGATHNPGNSPGIMSTGDYTLSGNVIIEIEGTAPGTQHDQVDVTGAVDITGGSLTALFTAGSYVNGDLLFILANDGTDAVIGTFTGLAQGDTVTSFGGFDWQISYEADSSGSSFTGGNDIALMAVPEPSIPVLAGSFGILALFRRRRI